MTSGLTLVILTFNLCTSVSVVTFDLCIPFGLISRALAMLEKIPPNNKKKTRAHTSCAAASTYNTAFCVHEHA